MPRLLPVLCCLLLLTSLNGAAQTPAKQADALRQQAEDCYNKGQYDKARRLYTQAYKLVQQTDPVRAANLCVDISSLDYMDERFDQAKARCLTGLHAINHHPAPPDSVRFKLYASLGSIYRKLYDRDSALFYYRQADLTLTRTPAVEQQIPEYVLYYYNNEGDWHREQADYDKSLRYLQKAETLIKRQHLMAELGYIESNLAVLYEEMAHLSNALTHRLLANKYYSKHDEQKVNILSGIGWTYFRLRNWRLAQTYLAAAETRLTQLRGNWQTSPNNVPQAINLRWMRAQVAGAMGQTAQANRWTQQATALHQRHLGLHGKLLAKIGITQAHQYAQRGQLTQAMQQYDQAINALCRPIPKRPTDVLLGQVVLDEPMLLYAYTGRAVLLRRQFDQTHRPAYLRQATEAFLAATKLARHSRHHTDTDPTLLQANARQYALWPSAVATLTLAYQRWRSPSLQAALFDAFEQARASSLNEALRTNALKPRTLPATLLAREQGLKQRIRQLQKKAAADSTATTDLTNAELDWHKLVAEFRQDYPAYYRLKYHDEPASLTALQEHLPAEAVYVCYLRSDADLYCFVATRQTADVICHRLDTTQFNRHIQALHTALVHDPGLGNYRASADAMYVYRHLIEPLRPWLKGKKRLLLVRDHSFASLPMEVLETGSRSHDYLARHYAVSYPFSAPTTAPAQPTNQPTLVVAPFARPAAIEKAANRRPAHAILPASEAEARQIGGEVLLGRGATKQRFLQTDLSRSMLVLATHAEANNQQPTQSFIAFAPSGEQDNNLYADELYDLPLAKTGLVVLSACETNAGPTLPGEGVLSLARAVAYAGCPAVVATGWKANDETTAYLSVKLHEHLTRGLPIDEALYQARLDFFDSPLARKYAHPYYWASFTLVGRTDPVLTATHWPFLAAGLLALVGGLVIWQRKRWWNV